ncbi:hypothetical protein BSKO_12185 [Bryopsis sp. KO-2023]|nr:hypothetical protein BSKO_12185 [Bryopsis sp. KO-2023]
MCCNGGAQASCSSMSATILNLTGIDAVDMEGLRCIWLNTRRTFQKHIQRDGKFVRHATEQDQRYNHSTGTATQTSLRDHYEGCDSCSVSSRVSCWKQ